MPIPPARYIGDYAKAYGLIGLGHALSAAATAPFFGAAVWRGMSRKARFATGGMAAATVLSMPAHWEMRRRSTARDGLASQNYPY